MGRIAVSVLVYCVWQERYQRLFQHMFRATAGVLRDIESYIRAKMCTWKLSKTYIDWLICRYWGVSDRVLM